MICLEEDSLSLVRFVDVGSDVFVDQLGYVLLYISRCKLLHIAIILAFVRYHLWLHTGVLGVDLPSHAHTRTQDRPPARTHARMHVYTQRARSVLHFNRSLLLPVEWDDVRSP